LKISQLIAIYRSIISNYDGYPERQEREFLDLVATLRKEIMPPP
jgi:hypothetical protein